MYHTHTHASHTHTHTYACCHRVHRCTCTVHTHTHPHTHASQTHTQALTHAVTGLTFVHRRADPRNSRDTQTSGSTSRRNAFRARPPEVRRSGLLPVQCTPSKQTMYVIDKLNR